MGKIATSLLASAVSAFAFLGGAQAGERLTVVELFTSQGCSSCPPADALMHELAKKDDVLALALHVDYWDYIGWKDEFAIASHTERQRGYARMAGSRTIYTPQMVIGGQDHVIGNRPHEVEKYLAMHADVTTPVTVEVSVEGQEVTINAASSERYARPLFVLVVEYDPMERVSIKRGENAGRVLDYVNIVKGWQMAGKWSDGDSWTGSVQLPGDNRYAVLVQEGPHGAILAAARAR